MSRLTEPSARTHQRCLAILCVLHESDEDHTGEELAALARFRPGTIYAELAILERKGLILGYWVSQGDDRPRRRLYRLTTKAERARHALLREAGALAARPVPRRRVLRRTARPWDDGDTMGVRGVW